MNLDDLSIDIDPYENLPEDPELAFLELEAYFRRLCEKRLANTDRNERTDVTYVNYMAQVLAAIDALELQANFRSQVPSIEEVDFNTYLNFNKDVEHYCTVLRVRNSRRAQGYSVRFDAVAKEKVNHHLTQLRDIFNKLEMEGKKKESLLFKLEDLQREIDSSRTRFDRFAALAIEASTLTGDVVEKSKVLEIFDSIARVFWGAQTDRQKQLPSPQAPKQIPGPKRFPAPSHSESKTSPNSMDDDIPF